MFLQVTYETDGFLEKNKDLLHADLVGLLSSCESTLTRQFSLPSGHGGPRANGDSQKQSVAAKFKVRACSFCSSPVRRNHQISTFPKDWTSIICEQNSSCLL